MNGLMQILKNKVTRNAILFTILIIFIYRIGAYIVTPGIDSSVINQATLNFEVSTLFDFFGGGSLGQMALFALGVSPYITASIVIQLLESDLIPAMSEWKHQGVDGQNKRASWNKNLTIIFAFVQAMGILIGYYLMQNTAIVSDPTMFGYVQVALLMTAGSAVIVWLSDRITEAGVGNGISVIISAGILSQIPNELNGIKSIIEGSATSYQGGSINFFSNPMGALTELFNTIKFNPELQKQIILWSIILLGTILLVIAIIYYSLAYRKIAINYVRGGSTMIKKNSYLPIKLNPAGVIPVIFVQPFLLLAGIGMNWMFTSIELFSKNGSGNIEQFFLAMTGDIQTGSENEMVFRIIYLITYGILILAFSIFYSYVQMNPEEIAKSLEKQSAYIISVRPGNDTLVYLTQTIKRTSFWGGLILMIIAIIPLLLQMFLKVNVNLSLIGTGLIIIVSVAVQIYQSLENKADTKKYRRILGE